VQHILSRQDLPEIIRESELRNALAVTCAMAAVSLRMSDAALSALTQGATCPRV